MFNIKNLLNRHWKQVVLTDEFPIFFDISRLTDNRQEVIKSGCKAMIEQGVLAQILADRANKLKTTIAVDATDWEQVISLRYRLLELNMLRDEIVRLGRTFPEPKPINRFKTL